MSPLPIPNYRPPLLPEDIKYNKSLQKIQSEIAVWADKNFTPKISWLDKLLGRKPKRHTWQPLLGVCEESGEIAHAYLKMSQKIRGSKDEHIIEAEDAVGDILIYLMDFCNLMGFDMQTVLESTWDKVKQRNWVKNKKDGINL